MESLQSAKTKSAFYSMNRNKMKEVKTLQSHALLNNTWISDYFNCGQLQFIVVVNGLLWA